MTAPPDADFDPSALDFANPVADAAAVRAVLPHRAEMELLTGIVRLDAARHRIVGYKDLAADEFWTRGHFPRLPLMPGVLMVEAAAQLTCYYAVSQKVVDAGSLMGLGGVEDARFLRPVRPGDRLVLVGEGVKVHRRLTKFRVTGYVGAEKAFEATVVGVPLGKWEELARAEG